MLGGERGVVRETRFRPAIWSFSVFTISDHMLVPVLFSHEI